MNKIIKISQNAEYYYEKALDKSDAGDYLGCLELLRLAQSYIKEPYNEDDLSIRLETADCYAALGLFEDSNREYFKLTAFDYCLDEVFYGIVKNYAMMDMTGEAAYYLNLGIETGILLPEDGFEPIDFDLDKAQKPHLRLVKPDDNIHTVQVAKSLLGAQDTNFARQMLLAVPEHSAQYAEAANCLALIEISEGNTEKGLTYIDRVLKENPSDIYALTTKVLALEMANRTDEAKAQIEALDALDISEWPGTAKVALCAAQAGDCPMAYKYLSRSLEFMPHDRDLLLMYTLAAANLNQYREAKDAAVKLMTLYPNDYAVRYYARAVNRFRDANADFELIPELPKEARMQYTALLEETLENLKDNESLTELTQSDPELFDAVLFGLYAPSCAYSSKLRRAVARDRAGFGTVRELLVDPDYPIIPKKELFTELLRAGRVRSVQMVVNHQIVWYRPNIPKEVKNKTLQNAYWQVYSALAFIDADFDRKLNIWFKKLNGAFKEAGITRFKENAVAAVLAYVSRINKIFSKIPYACEVFDCSEEDFNAYYFAAESFLKASKPMKKNAAVKHND